MPVLSTTPFLPPFLAPAQARTPPSSSRPGLRPLPTIAANLPLSDRAESTPRPRLPSRRTARRSRYRHRRLPSFEFGVRLARFDSHTAHPDKHHPWISPGCHVEVAGEPEVRRPSRSHSKAEPERSMPSTQDPYLAAGDASVRLFGALNAFYTIESSKFTV
ncbi:hypothetical protein PENSPDRAFT_654376 [Peniophora sp. CONT]|nr:hypothetical protein PENSPDRAFT_654376 [Peniophora sp. CONT]